MAFSLNFLFFGLVFMLVGAFHRLDVLDEVHEVTNADAISYLLTEIVNNGECVICSRVLNLVELALDDPESLQVLWVVSLLDDLAAVLIFLLKVNPCQGGKRILTS